MTVGDLTKHVDNRDQSAVMNILHVNSTKATKMHLCYLANLLTFWTNFVMQCI